MYCWSANELGAKFIAQIVQSFRNSQPFLAIFSFVVFSGGILGGTLGGICFHTLLKEETRTRILRMTPPRPGMFCFVQYLTGMCIQGASLRRWLVPPATLAHKQELTKLRTKRTENSTILGANGRLGNAKSFMLLDNNPDATCMYEIHRKGQSERAVLYLTEIETKVRSFAHHTTAV